jgi:mono/diheme cytochrome c family protein
LLKYLRRRRSFSQWAAAVLLLAGWLVPLSVPHTADDDLLCVAGDGVAGASQAWLMPGGIVKHPGHCVICHAARTFRSSLTESGPVVTTLSTCQSVEALDRPARRPSTFDRLPARAPPQA